MEEMPGPQRRPGGSVEPLDRGFAAKEPVKAIPVAAERFELRDPRADLTYRGKTFVEMVTRANQIGASRFTAIAADGTRTTVSRTGGTWRRDDLPPPEPTRPSKEPPRSAEALPFRSPGTPSDPSKDSNETKAEQALRIARIEAALNERYLIKRAPIVIGDVTIGQTEYRLRGDTSRVAFTESTFRLSTDNNNPSVARSMVDVAEARGWQALRVSGNEDFRRMVWLESSLRGVKTIGYEPMQADQELLRREREARQVNRIEPLPHAAATPGATRPAERGSGGRKAVLAALEAVLVAKNVPARQREAVMAAAAENLAARLRNGETHRVKVYDKAAPAQRPAVTPTREVHRDRERGAPAR